MKNVLIEIHRRGSLKDWEILSIQKWFHAHQTWVVDYYKISNTATKEWFSTRFHYPSVLTEGQKEYVQVLEDISNLVESLKPGDNVYVLMTKWSKYHHKLQCFFKNFNRIHFELSHAYFSRKEHADYCAKLLEDCLSPNFGPTIYHCGKDDFRNIMMKRDKIEDSHWHLAFGVQYIQYCENVVIHMKALKSGVAPKSKNSKAPSVLTVLDDQWDVPSDLQELFMD